MKLDKSASYCRAASQRLLPISMENWMRRPADTNLYANNNNNSYMHTYNDKVCYAWIRVEDIKLVHGMLRIKRFNQARTFLI